MTGLRALRKVVRWSFAAVVPGEVVLVVCLGSGIRVAPAARITVGLAVFVVFVAAATVLALDCHRHRREGLDRRQAVLAAVSDSVPVPVRKLTVHEVWLFTSFLRWVTRRGRHGVREGDIAVPYASGQTAMMYGFLFVSVVETVALAYLIPWPVVHMIVLVLDVWGVYFVIALHASCVVRPHVIGADGALWLRYGVLLGIRIPARRIASARVERRFPESGLAAVDKDGGADIAVAGQTTVTVELTEPIALHPTAGQSGGGPHLPLLRRGSGISRRRTPCPCGLPQDVIRGSAGTDERSGACRRSYSTRWGFCRATRTCTEVGSCSQPVDRRARATGPCHSCVSAGPGAPSGSRVRRTRASGCAGRPVMRAAAS